MPDLVVTDKYECEEHHQKFTIQMRVPDDMPTAFVRSVLDARAAWAICLMGEHFTPDQRVSRMWRAFP